MKLQQVLSVTRKAVDDYHMIEAGDNIAVGISGGKDSLTLLHALHGLKRFYPEPFTLQAITVDLGFQNLNLEEITKMCAKLDVPYHIVKTDIGKIIFEDRKESNPCSLCAKMRKGALNDAIKKTGCNKVAYAHHKDDVVETMLMSLIYIKEADVIGFMNKYGLPVVKSPCPADGHTKREYVKTLLRDINLDAPGVKERMFTAIQGSLDYWLPETQILQEKEE